MYQFLPKFFFFIAFILLFPCPKVNANDAEFTRRRLFTFQREQISRPGRNSESFKSSGTKEHQRIICINGKSVHRKCVCKRDHFGEHCERKMFCKGFERERNLSCVECNENFVGPFCDHPKCRNGGEEHPAEQRCQCPQPYSGDFCETLREEDVYRFYNTKAALVGPLGILTVIPMLFCFYMCEKKARIRQVNRIQKSWSEQRKASIELAQIAHLLAEKV